METAVLYLFKSACWLTGFGAVYYIFLRNERFFALKRYYLVAGIIAALILPLFDFHYKVTIPADDMSQMEVVSVEARAAEASSWLGDLSGLGILLVSVYMAGMLFLLIQLVKNTILIFAIIRKSEIISYGKIRLIRSPEFRESFSFFNYVFINPSVSGKEMNEILNHELVHVGQKHWLDLLLAEFIGFLQWVNPFVWIYSGFIRLNHEYLADEVALRRTSDTALYKAALLNQLFRSPVISLSSSFACSINKKRFEMMKVTKASPYRRMKIFFVLPVLAMLFFAFAEPEYNYSITPGSTLDEITIRDNVKQAVSGRVTSADGKPLEGAAIIVSGTTVGTLSDAKGSFRISNIPDDADLVISFVGYRTMVLRPEFKRDILVEMIPDTLNYADRNTRQPDAPPPPPPPPPLRIKSAENAPPPLIVLDGVVTDMEIGEFDPQEIESINVLKDKTALDKYGERGKNGVIEITSKDKDLPPVEREKRDVLEPSKPGDQKAGRDQMVVVEEFPEFPGGMEALIKWMIQNVKYPPEAAKAKIMGKVIVSFVVTKIGKIENVNVKEPVHTLLDAEAARVISSMPAWKPGTQAGKPVDVVLSLPVEFKLK